MKVLDAGCGVGGTAIYIVKKTGAKVYGITLSENQVKLAQKYAKKNQVSESVDFSVQNYNKTSFPNNCFDIVYGIESICHAYTKEKFLLEAKRILKPGGKLIIMDGYTSRKVKTKEEKEIIKKFTEGFVLKELIEVNKMTDLIRRTGFVKVRSINKIDAVIPSLEYFHKEMQKNKWLAKLLLLIPHPYFQTIIMNMQATENAYKGVKIGLATYYIHYAEKPHT